jgi:hypothetical protein
MTRATRVGDDGDIREVGLTFIPLLSFQSIEMFAGVEVLNEHYGSNRQNGQNISLPEIQVSVWFYFCVE